MTISKNNQAILSKKKKNKHKQTNKQKLHHEKVKLFVRT
jgi:hypothetical protein